MHLRLLYFFSIIISTTSLCWGQAVFLSNETALEFKNKRRITEILNRENYGMIEPFFYVSNRPTIEQALAEEIKNRTLVSPVNYMVYCPNGQDYFKTASLNTGSIYIAAENLPKNGAETDTWFNEAYKYRKDSDPLRKPANVAIVSATRQNFLRVQCPNTHNHIIVSSAPSPTGSTDARPQQYIDTVKNLRFGDNPQIGWNTYDYNLPSHIKDDYIASEKLTFDELKAVDINPPANYIPFARNSASQYGILLRFLLAIAEVASKYNPNKISQQGDRLGIMQVPTDIAKLYGFNRDDLFNTQKSFDIASFYIKDLNKEYNGNIENILQAYYLGFKPSALSEDIPNIPQARNFSAEVTRRIDTKQPIVFDE